MLTESSLDKYEAKRHRSSQDIQLSKNYGIELSKNIDFEGCTYYHV